MCNLQATESLTGQLNRLSMSTQYMTLLRKLNPQFFVVLEKADIIILDKSIVKIII